MTDILLIVFYFLPVLVVADAVFRLLRIKPLRTLSERSYLFCEERSIALAIVHRIVQYLSRFFLVYWATVKFVASKAYMSFLSTAPVSLTDISVMAWSLVVALGPLVAVMCFLRFMLPLARDCHSDIDRVFDEDDIPGAGML